MATPRVGVGSCSSSSLCLFSKLRVARGYLLETSRDNDYWKE